MDPFTLLFALFGLMIFMMVAVIPLYMIFICTRIILRGLKKTYTSVIKK